MFVVRCALSEVWHPNSVISVTCHNSAFSFRTASYEISEHDHIFDEEAAPPVAVDERT